MRPTVFFSSIVVAVFLSSCAGLHFPHRAYVSSYHEPLLVSDKGESQFSAGVSPFKYLYASGAYSPVKNIVGMAHCGGWKNLINVNVSLSYYNKVGKISWFTGLTGGFQDNTISRWVNDLIGTGYKVYSYSCGFRSAGVVTGCSFGTKRQLHLGMRGLYNVVDRYNYEYLEKPERDYTTNLEKVHRDIPNFFSLQPSLSYVWKGKKTQRSWYKFQLEFDFTQISYVHDLRDGGTEFDYPDKVKLQKVYHHPAAMPCALIFSYIFHGKKTEK